MRLLAKSIDHIDHPLQGEVESFAYDAIFEALGIAERLDFLALKFLPEALKIEPDANKASALVKKWAAWSLCDYICQSAHAGELIFCE